MQTPIDWLGVIKRYRLSAISIGLVTFYAVVAAAAGLSQADYNYLEKEFGFRPNGFTLAHIGPVDADRLNKLINDPAFRDRPGARRMNVTTALLEAERNSCDNWERSHASAICPDVNDVHFMAGWIVAERRCIQCHLTGTTEAPSFYSLAKSRVVTEQFLAKALAAGHAMSPITLSADEVRELALYINSLRQGR
jgi:hypothetical protein